MHILEVYLESGGFDHRLIKGGISVYIWNLTRAFNAAGHRTSVLSALNGQHDLLAADHGLKPIDYQHDWSLRLDADPLVWGDRAAAPFELATRAYHLRKDETDFYYLSNTYLDLYPDSYYPPYEGKGSDPGFFKPLIFQLEAIAFIRAWFGDEALLLHAHEPFYQYLLPIAFADDPTKTMVSTVQSNMPIAKKLYLPETRSALAAIGGDPARIKPAPPPADTLLNRCMLAYLPRTHLNYPYRDDHVSLYDLVLDHSDAVDFLSEGHLDFYTSFRGTAFRALFTQLPIFARYRDQAGKLFVGGCGLGAGWLALADRPADRHEREAVLASLGLDPSLPSFYHNARYAPNHKGQVEIVLAARRFLEAGGAANFILRCISGTGIPDARFHALARDFPGRVFLTWQMQDEAELMAMARAADFGLFPSKFEMDTFLIAQGEAMAAGCVPVAADQAGMRHWRHAATARGERTGFPVIRSFREEDPALVESLVARIEEAVALYADSPAYAALAERARARARDFGWHEVGARHLAAFAGERLDPAPAAPSAQGWRAEALDRGELLTARSAGAGGLPALTLADGTLTYRCAEAVGVLAFAWQDGAFHEQAARHEAAAEAFVIEAVPSDRIILLVTLDNGDQYWDGTIAPDTLA